MKIKGRIIGEINRSYKGLLFDAPRRWPGYDFDIIPVGNLNGYGLYLRVTDYPDKNFVEKEIK